MTGRISLLAISLAIIAGSSDAFAQSEGPHAERVRPGYKRDREGRPEPLRPPAKEVPADLVLKKSAPPQRDVPANREAEPVPGASTPPSLRGEAALAAHWAAEEVSKAAGWREYYRIGAYEGLRAATGDPSIGAWDFREGVRLGLRDPEALQRGAEVGSRAADDAASLNAEQQVATQFHDLSREPRHEPRAVPPPYTFDPEWTIDPELIEVLRETSPAGPGAGALIRALEGSGYDLPRFYGCGSYHDFHDASWSDPGRAFARWREDRHRSATFARLGESDRRLFEQAFREEFARRLPDWFEVHERRGHRAGFEEGFVYGAGVRQEWQFRLGYNDGFDQAAVTSAMASYIAGYPLAYERSYRAEFEDWSKNPRLEILSVTLSDGNDDGVFEPGEELFARYEVVNYGGRGGTFPVVLDGRALERAAQTSMSIPPRTVSRAERPLPATITVRTPIRKRTALDFRVAEATRDLDVFVSRPLEFRGGATIADVDTLAGRAVVAVQVVNRSRRAVPTSVEIEPGAGYEIARLQNVETIEGGQSRSIAFELRGVRPLDLLSGSLTTRFTAASGITLHDELSYSFPNLALDLANRDLVRYLAALSRDAAAPAGDVAFARSLLMGRLRIDWRAAIESDTNPYKEDARKHGTSTTMGDLAQTYAAGKREIRNAEVFGGLGAEIQRLATTLPGAHPLLRKHLKKLAERVTP